MDKTTGLRVAAIRNFNRFYTNVIGLVNQTILESPYSLAEARILLEINQVAACTASDLSGKLQIDPGYLSRILRRFKKEGLVTTARSAQDGRSQILGITAKGRETFRQLSSASDRQLVQLMQQLPPSAQHTLVSHMQAIQNMLSGQPDNSVTIRSQQPGDAGYIIYRHAVLYSQEYGLAPVFEKYVLQSLATYLEKPDGGQILVAECCGKIVGFIGIMRADAITAQLRWFLIEPEFRGAGLGHKLLAAAMEYCRRQNYRQVFLWTFKGLDTACHLYEKFGFRLTEEKLNHDWQEQVIEQRWDKTGEF